MLESYLSTAGVVLPFLLKGFWETLKISFFAIIAGSLLGFVIGVVRSYRIRGLHQLLGLYIHVLRGTPFLVQLYIFYFVLPSSGIAAALGLGDGGLRVAVGHVLLRGRDHPGRHRGRAARPDRGRHDAGPEALQILRLVILPQALRLIVQPMSGVYVMLIKSTAILSVVGITELTRQGEVFIITFPAKSLFIYAMIAAIYFLYCYPLLRGQLAGKAAGRRPARRQPQLERTPPSTMPTEYVDTYYKRTLSDPQTRYPALAGRKAPRSAWWAAAGPCRSRWNWPGAAGRSRCWKAAASPGAPRAATAARSRPRSRPAPTPSAAMWTRIITARFTGCRWRAWRSSAPTSATWTSATPTRSTAACAWCATTPATRCSAGAMNSSGFRARRARAVARPAARAAGDRGLFPGRGRSTSFHFHPLNYARALARSARLGVRIHEDTPAQQLALDGAVKQVATAGGRVEARTVVLATGGYTGALQPALRRAMLPIATYIMLTEPLGERVREAIRSDAAIGDDRRAGNYRVLDGGRIGWGSRITTGSTTRPTAETLRRELLSVYPQLQGLRVETTGRDAWPTRAT